LVGKSEIYILTSAGFKKEGEEFAYSYSDPESAWAAYAEFLGNLIMEKRKKSSDIILIEWINKPKIISYQVEKFNSGNGTLKKKVFNIYSRLIIK